LDLVDAARGAAAAGAAQLRGAARPGQAEWTEKARHDFVTDVDRAVEALVGDTLRAAVPGSAVVGEELTPRAARDGDVVWILDPLDGTTNFLHGYRGTPCRQYRRRG
jgi:myo-inositol-1(or 4)-monophosphatase